MAMITGDNPLTACHVARELRFTSKKSTLVLTKVDADVDENFEWQSIDQVCLLMIALLILSAIRELIKKPLATFAQIALVVPCQVNQTKWWWLSW